MEGDNSTIDSSNMVRSRVENT
jgi:serine/threonine protein kinase